MEYIHEYGKGAKTLFATHYHELNDLEGLFPRVKNFHVTVKEVGREVIFLRKIKEGGSAHSFGIHVARMAGMPGPVLESAERTLKALENSQALEKAGALIPVKPHNTREGHVEKDGSLEEQYPGLPVVGITNGGGIRAPIAAGDVAKKDITTVLPFKGCPDRYFMTTKQNCMPCCLPSLALVLLAS